MKKLIFASVPLSLFLLVGISFGETAVPAAGMEKATDTQAAPAVQKDILKASVKVGTSVQARELVGENTTFLASTDQLWAWSLIEGAQTPTEVKHVWTLDGKEIASIPLKITASRFRTYSYISVAGRKGKGNVQVLDETGNKIASADFEIKATVAAPVTPTAPEAPAAPVQK